MLKLTLTLSAIYLAAVGLGLMLFPLHFGVGAVPGDASRAAGCACSGCWAGHFSASQC